MSGLLGMLSGLGQGVSSFGASMFDRELDMDRERRLQAIRDKEYKRARQDTLADMQTQMDYQTSERIAGQGFTTSERLGTESFREGLTEREEKLRRDLADIAQGGLKTVEQDSNGTFFAIDGNGKATELTDLQGAPYTFGDLSKVYQSVVSGITNGSFFGEEENARSFASDLQAAMSGQLGDGFPDKTDMSQFPPYQQKLLQRQMQEGNMTFPEALELLRNDSRFQ